MNINRRGFLGLLAAPAVVAAANLMPVRSLELDPKLYDKTVTGVWVPVDKGLWAPVNPILRFRIAANDAVPEGFEREQTVDLTGKGFVIRWDSEAGRVIAQNSRP